MLILIAQTKVSFLIPAAGIGQRFDAHTPKQFFVHKAKSLANRCLEKILGLPYCFEVLVAIDPKCQKDWKLLNLPVQFVDGGSTRQESVINLLDYFLKYSKNPCKQVWIHDLARPNIHLEDFAHLYEKSCKMGNQDRGLVLARKMTDSLSEIDEEGRIVHCLERQSIVKHLTPQIFSARSLRNSYRQLQQQKSQKICTDEAEAFSLTGGQVQIVLAQEESHKITTKADLDFLLDP